MYGLFILIPPIFLCLAFFNIVSPSIVGIFVYGYSKIVLFPDIVGFIIYLYGAILTFYLVYSMLCGLEIDQRKMGFIFVVLFALVYLYKVDSDHFILTDSYTLLANTVDLMDGNGLRYNFSLSFALFILPFMALYLDEFAAQLGIIFYQGLALLFLYKFLRLYLPRNASYIIILLVMMNPLYVAVSRTISYEPILFFLFSLNLYMLGRILEKMDKNERISMIYLFFEGVILVLISLVRFPYIIIVVIPSYAILILRIIVRISEKSPDVTSFYYIKHLMALLLMGLVNYLIVVSLINMNNVVNVVSENVEFSISRFLLLTFMSTSVPNTIPFRTGFLNYIFATGAILFFNVIVEPIVLLLVFLGFIYVGKRDRWISGYLALIALTNISAFSIYREFQTRYLYLCTLVGIIFFGVGLYVLVSQYRTKRRNLSRNSRTLISLLVKVLLVIFIIINVTILNATIMVSNWDHPAVKIANSSQISKEDIERLYEVIGSYKGEKIIFSSAMVSASYFYNYKYDIGLTIIGLGAILDVYGVNNETLRYILSLINEYVEDGYIVFYIASWPEIDGYHPRDSDYSFSWFYSNLKRSCNYTLLLQGPYTYRTSWKYYAPAYELLLITEVSLSD